MLPVDIRLWWKFAWSYKDLTKKYWAAANQTLADHPASFSPEEAQACLWPWLKSMALSRGSLRDATPWMPFPAIRFLDTLLSSSSRVFEYGAGGSTVFFASRVGELVSVEHDREWLDKTSAAVLRRGNARWRNFLGDPKVPPTPITLQETDPLSYLSTDPQYAGMSFFDYASFIDQYPDNYFDLILIDGRARPSCFMHAAAKVKHGGYVVLDNAERVSYAYVEETALKLGFEVQEFWGPGPYNDYCWRTIFLRRVRERFALNELDTQLERYLDFDGGVFVEAGANDGIRQSNSLYFEGKRGWRGILVEAVPELVEQCRRHRPQAMVKWAALVPPERVPGQSTIRFAGLMSMVQGGMHSREEEDSHIAAGLAVQKICSYETQAPNATLSGILDELGISHVDLLSLDVEGFEAEALAGLDLARHQPSFILVEARYRNDVDARLLPMYHVVAMLSHHDVLYRLGAGGSAKASHV